MQSLSFIYFIFIHFFTVEELTCLGVWKEGTNHYLVGIAHNRANSNADK